MATSKLTIRDNFFTSTAESVFNDIASRGNKFYYFLGKPLPWYTPGVPDRPTNSNAYETEVRNNIVYVKEIRPSDVSLTVPRVNWTPGTVYDYYDDSYGDSLIGIDLVSGGENYSLDTRLTVVGGLEPDGSPAVIEPVIDTGSIVGVNVLYPGYGYISQPTIEISDPSEYPGNGAFCQAVIAKPYTQAARYLNQSKFYVLTDDFHIYKCLDNNNNSPSTSKPTGTLYIPFSTADNYIWVYIGTILPSQRSKFLTVDYMPVTKALTTNFYSKGEIKYITVINPGNGYTSATVTVSGNGFKESNPLLITGYTISNSGEDYTTASLSFTPPVGVTANWTPDTEVFTGTVLEYKRNIYEVIISGTTHSSSGPVHLDTAATNGTAGLKYRGTRVTGNVVLDSGNISSVVFDGFIGNFIIVNSGTGYTYPPPVTFTGGGGSGAEAYAVVRPNSTLSRIIVSNPGEGYTSAPTLTIGTQWESNQRVFLGDQLFYGERLYTVTQDSGNVYTELGTTVPVHVTGSETNGNAVLTYAGEPASATVQLLYGKGYNLPPVVNVTGDGANAVIGVQTAKTSADIAPIIQDGQLTGAVILDGGIGYTSAILTVTGDGLNGELSATLSQGDLLSIQANNELTTVAGAIDRVIMVSKGYGYTAGNAIVTIIGDGTGATATANVLAGRVDRIIVTDRGSGYTKASVVITDNSIANTGKGATARCILPPYGGHGYNIVQELNARQLSIQTSIVSENNQGFNVTNEYRQYGIIKNINKYGDIGFLNSATGSTCWSVTSSSTIDENITKDTLLVSTNTGRYVVVDRSAKSLLLLSIDDIDISSGDVLSLSGSYSFTVETVIPPTADKYTGAILYIDNRPSFATTNQVTTLKTIFNF